MEISHLLARLFGIIFIVLFASVLINKSFYRHLWQDVSKHPGSLIVSGFILLICGLLVINVHNVWTPDWKGLITLLGWIFFIGGICRLVIPQTFLKVVQKEMKNNFALNLISIIMLVIGIFLTIVGFG